MSIPDVSISVSSSICILISWYSLPKFVRLFDVEYASAPAQQIAQNGATEVATGQLEEPMQRMVCMAIDNLALINTHLPAISPIRPVHPIRTNWSEIKE